MIELTEWLYCKDFELFVVRSIMSFFSSTEMAHSVDSKDMLHARCFPNKQKLKDIKRRGKFQEKGLNTVFSMYSVCS